MPDSLEDKVWGGTDAGGAPEVSTVHAGIIPLLDCAPLVVAAEFGFAEKYNLRLEISREQSWASIRDKVTIGHLDCAHMLGPMVIASTLGIGHVRTPLIAPMALGLNGNAITVSNDLHDRLIAAGLGGDVLSGARALKAVIDADRAAGRPPLTFGVVFPFSAHNYELRGWLAAAGINPDFDLRLVVIPPPLMVANLDQGLIDGFCVGAPWNAVAVEAGVGEIVTTKSRIWHNGPEKVLGVRATWAAAHPRTLNALIRALVEAAQWVERPENRRAVAETLAAPHYLGIAAPILAQAMAGDLPGRAPGGAVNDPDFITFFRDDATFPWRSHAAWFTEQMIRWRQIDQDTDICALAEQVYRPDIYRDAVRPLGLAVPDGDWKPEGTGPSRGRFFGDAVYDPECG
ncbi:ABC transporter substrate-binding protein [Thalassospiraceae bacterium LMO-SO8]|nr:ABC transporter substrate-binding protein [Alphaproteobacteria bacterium LMO-S08]WND77152.1 ABC transporter substrate-binding protein [Thalassospiraceae bacterium LMO-SO8]